MVIRQKIDEVKHALNDMCKALLETQGVSELSENDMRMMNPLALAYIGDGVHEVLVRTYVLSKYKGTVNQLNQRVVKLIKATAQAQALRAMQPFLSEDELAVAKRGRNQKSLTVPKNTSVGEYRQATGFESLLGWLFLRGEEARLVEIVSEAIRLIEAGESPKDGHLEQPYE